MLRMPGRLRALFTRLAGSLAPGRTDPDLDRELEAHLALLAERFATRGMGEVVPALDKLRP